MEPLITFAAVPHTASSSAVTSLCFVGGRVNDGDIDASTTTTDHNEEKLSVEVVNDSVEQSSEQFQNNNDNGSASSDGGSSVEDFDAYFGRTSNQNGNHSYEQSIQRHRQFLQGRLLAICDFSGQALLWDVGRTRVVQLLLDEPRGPGLALRRIMGDSGSDGATRQILYQTRDPLGIVSLYDIQDEAKLVTEIATHSHTFCAAAPCHGNAHLVALPDGRAPSQRAAQAVVRDWRVPSSAAPVATFTTTGHGMLTSLAMYSSSSGNNNNLLVCGMEDGSLIFTDWTRLGVTIDASNTSPVSPSTMLSLGTDPVLAVDVSPSPHVNEEQPPSCVCLAGLAGEAHSDSSDQGRLAIVKTTWRDDTWCSRLRTRLGTATSTPGVAVCRFCPGNGRLFAAGGWDKRVRIFHRDGRPLTILRGAHDKGIQAVDWASDAATSGLLASASSDGRVSIWKTYGGSTTT